MRNEDDIIDEMDDPMDTAPTPKKAKKAKKKAKVGTDKKPSKAVVTKPAKAVKGKAAKAEKPAKAPRPKSDAADVSTTQPDDAVTLKAVHKLKEATMASQLAAGMGVHRRVIRAQLQRLAKTKTNGVKMVKDGYNWIVSSTAK